MSDVAGFVIVFSDNPLDFHPKLLSIVPLKFWKYLKTGWKIY